MKIRCILTSLLLMLAMTLSAQNSLPAPGSGSAPGGFGGGGGFGPGPGPAWNGGGPGPCMGGWNGCWGGPWGPPPATYVYSPVIQIGAPGWQNSGTITVVGVGYDATGVWRNLPLRVQYSYNGIQYNAEVLNAWDPWTQSWDYGVDVQAVNTSYYLRGHTYNFYVVLSFGTFYFNL